MLEIGNLENVNSIFVNLIAEFRRYQVSRFPIQVVTNPPSDLIGFVDSRFPTDKYSKEYMVAMIYIKEYGENPTLTIESRLISNDKYASYNDEYHTKSTKDMKKMLKFMREYIKPFSAHEVANRSKRSAENKFQEWQQKPNREMREIHYKLPDNAITETFLKLKELGVAPVNEHMRMMYDSLIPAYLEREARTNKKFSDYVHAFVNPDESVFISRVGIDAGRTEAKFYETLDQTPQKIKEGIAILNMMDKDAFVPEVGYKATHREFWLEGFPHDENS